MIRILKEFAALVLVLAVGGVVVIGLQRTVGTSSPSTYDTFQAKVNAIPVVILTPSGGQILSLPAAEGTAVNVGQTLATIQVFDRNYRPPADSQVLKLQGDKLQIISPVTGVVGRLSVAPLSLVGGNQTLMDLYAAEDTDLHVMVPQGDSLTTYRAFYAAATLSAPRYQIKMEGVLPIASTGSATSTTIYRATCPTAVDCMNFLGSQQLVVIAEKTSHR